MYFSRLCNRAAVAAGGFRLPPEMHPLCDFLSSQSSDQNLQRLMNKAIDCNLQQMH